MLPAIEHIQWFSMSRAMVCLDCKAVSDTAGDCPACASGKLWPLEKWLERDEEQLTGREEALCQQQN